MKNIRYFYLKIFIILVVKFSVYLNRHVFVMKTSLSILFAIFDLDGVVKTRNRIRDCHTKQEMNTSLLL